MKFKDTYKYYIDHDGDYWVTEDNRVIAFFSEGKWHYINDRDEDDIAITALAKATYNLKPITECELFVALL
jgi:hypothetical protein